MLRCAVIVATIALLGAATVPVWLDVKPLAHWNAAGATIPAAPGPNDSELAAGGRCASELRPPTQPEDRALVRKGWSLVGPYQRYGRLSVVVATSSADGMCRPNGFQAFVFSSGNFAGTLSPHLMNSRSDASLSPSIRLQNERELGATFARYSESDPLCCPHASTNVSYEIGGRSGRGTVQPVSSQTDANAPSR